MILTVVVRIKNISYVNITLYCLEKYASQFPIFIIVPKIFEQYVGEIRKLTFLKPSFVVEDDTEDVCGISKYISTETYLFFEESHIMKNFLPSGGKFDRVPCSLETFPHGNMAWTANRYQWFDAFRLLQLPFPEIYSRKCMTISPQIFDTKLAQKLFERFGKVNIPLYWFSIGESDYKPSSDLWSPELCDNAIHTSVPADYLRSNIKNAFKNHSIFMTVSSPDLLQTVYENMPKPSYASLKNMLDELVLYKGDIPFIRLGEDRDGGYVVCDIPATFLYSYGVGNSYVFEQDFVRRYNCEMAFLYDHTVDIKIPDPKLRHEKLGIDHYKHDDLDTIESQIVKNGHQDRHDLCLKIDVEGYEWLPLLFISENCLCQFSQIIIELHWLDTDFCGTIDQKTTVLKKINKFFRLVHVHGVNCQEPKLVNGMKIHPVIEATFVRKDMFLEEPCLIKNPKLPIDLDRPIDLCLKEVSLSDYYPWNRI